VTALSVLMVMALVFAFVAVEQRAVAVRNKGQPS